MTREKKKFVVAAPGDDGNLEIHPMKAWLRQHSDYLPDGFDQASSNSHQLRNALIKNGWTLQVTQTEELLLMPGIRQQHVADKKIGITLYAVRIRFQHARRYCQKIWLLLSIN